MNERIERPVTLSEPRSAGETQLDASSSRESPTTTAIATSRHAITMSGYLSAVATHRWQSSFGSR
jgi:hypothetical protein